jgi:hypothetical protein
MPVGKSLKEEIVTRMTAAGIGTEDKQRMDRFAGALAEAIDDYLLAWMTYYAGCLHDLMGQPPSVGHVFDPTLWG